MSDWLSDVFIVVDNTSSTRTSEVDDDLLEEYIH